jgi:UDP-N-acetylmuramoyl-tripeptide--D-alanyl-D-alanine ligase
VEHLGSIENVAAAKAELVEGMKEGGTAILNADDPRVANMRGLSRGKTLTFGIENPADIEARDIRFKGFGKTSFLLCYGGAEEQVDFPLDGTHNILNALSASAVGITFGMSLRAIAESLGSVTAPPQRGEILHFKSGFTVINDSYNSNPDALLSMVKTVVAGKGSAKRTIVVAGEMLELGSEAAAIHRETGAAIAAAGVDMLVGVRGLAQPLVEGAAAAGLVESSFAADSGSAAELMISTAAEGDVILIKGSRGVKTEKIVERMLEVFELEEKSTAA